MDFLGSEASGFTIQDMIECDMNSEFSDHLAELNYPRVSSPNLSVNTSDCGIQHNGMGMGMDLGFGLLNDSKGLHDNSWLQPAVNVNEIQGLVPVENTDPNLLVNPKTGLPTSPIAKSSPVSLSEPSVVKDAVLSSTESASPTIQFIASPVPASSSIATTSQQAISVQPATVTYMTTPLSSSTPSTLKNIQNNTHSSISSVTTYHQTLTQHLLSSNNNHKITGKSRLEERTYPKPVYSYSCLIAMALKNSETGALPVSEIYSFMTENFPYFKIAPDGWKNSVRHNLSLNKCFEKIENPKATGNSRKGCLWGLNPLKIDKMDEEITKWRKKDPQSVKKSMARPDKLEILEKGNIGSHSPHHPNNVKGTTGEELSSTVDAVHRLLQQQYQTSPASSSSSSSSSSSISSPSSSSSSSDAGSAPATPTKPQAPPTHAPPPHVSLIEIRPMGGGDAKSTIRALKLETTGGVTGVTQQQLLQARHRLQHSTTTSSMIKGEFITIKNEPDVVVKDEPEEEEDEEEDMEGLELHDPSLADISLQVGGGIWDHDLSNEGITLDDLPINSSNFNFSFGTNSLTSSPATVQSVTGVGA